MTINQGLSSLINSSPNFSNQGLENAINDIKTKVDRDWVTRTFDLDQAIEDNNVLSLTQKNDLKETINTHAHLNVGRYLNDVIRHTSTILDGSIVPLEDPDNDVGANFLELLQSVQGLQSTIPNLYGVSAEDKKRGVDDHFGILRGKLLETEDSSKPVFESLIEHLQTLNRHNVNAIKDDGDIEVALDNLKNFIDSVVADSTDFQQTLNSYATAVDLAFRGAHLFLLNAGIYGEHTDIQALGTQLVADREKVVTQMNLEISNLSGIRTYITSLTEYFGYTNLAQDTKLSSLITKISNNADWRDYFENYNTRQNNSDPIYTIDADSDKESVINQVLIARGLPEVVDYMDLESVANKAKKDSRIDTKEFDLKTTEQIITKSCEQLSIVVSIRSIYNQSRELLDNMNKFDRQLIANELDLNESSNTIS